MIAQRRLEERVVRVCGGGGEGDRPDLGVGDQPVDRRARGPPLGFSGRGAGRARTLWSTLWRSTLSHSGVDGRRQWRIAPPLATHPLRVVLELRHGHHFHRRHVLRHGGAQAEASERGVRGKEQRASGTDEGRWEAARHVQDCSDGWTEHIAEPRREFRQPEVEGDVAPGERGDQHVRRSLLKGAASALK